MSEEIFKISKDVERAKALLEMSKERFGSIKIFPKNLVYRIAEEYYEIIKELLTAIMYSDGYKTLSHKMLITYLADNYSLLKDSERFLMDSLRKLRNDIVYYGKKISQEFLENNQKEIDKIINKLIKFVEKKLKWAKKTNLKNSAGKIKF